MKILFALIACASLAGCANKPFLLDTPKPLMPADIRQPCDPVPAAPARGSNMGNLYEWSDGMVDLYADCALRDRAKLRWIESQGM